MVTSLWVAGDYIFAVIASVIDPSVTHSYGHKPNRYESARFLHGVESSSIWAVGISVGKKRVLDATKIPTAQISSEFDP
jgi:hypothetical protein